MSAGNGACRGLELYLPHPATTIARYLHLPIQFSNFSPAENMSWRRFMDERNWTRKRGKFISSLITKQARKREPEAPTPYVGYSRQSTEGSLSTRDIKSLVIALGT